MEYNEKLPHEGERKLVIKTTVRQECHNCGEPAVYRFTYLLERWRSNPASAGYNKDDCRYCEDAVIYACGEKECTPSVPTGCSSHSEGRYTIGPSTAHMFLTVKEEPTAANQQYWGGGQEDYHPDHYDEAKGG